MLKEIMIHYNNKIITQENVKLLHIYHGIQSTIQKLVMFPL